MKIFQLFKWIRSNKLWVFIVTAIGINAVVTITGLSFSSLSFSRYSEFPFSSPQQVPFEFYLIKKWFLVIVSFCVLIHWLLSKKISYGRIKSFILPCLVISLSLFITRSYSFDGWFWHEDFRMIKYYYTNFGVADYHYPLAVFFLVIHWFGLNYIYYNILGLLFFVVAAIIIYFIGNQLQKREYISLLSALFFITSPSYFQEWFLTISFVGDSFAIILFLISFYMLLKNFLPGALIFAAAALEFGIVRTHFISFYLVATGLLFNSSKSIRNKNLMIKLSPFIIIFLIYIPVALQSVSFSTGNVLFDFNQLNNIYTIGNMLGEIAVPFTIFSPLMKYLGSILNNWIYLPVVTGYAVVLIASLVTVISYYNKKSAWKILLLGLLIFTTGIIVPALIGRRVDHNVGKFLEHHQAAPYPTVTTSYSLVSVVGVTLFLIGLGNLVQPKIYIIIMFLTIVANVAVYAKSDILWIEGYARAQHKQNEQLRFLLSESDPIYIYVIPSTSPYLKHYQRHLWQGIRNFQLAYRSNQTINTYMDKKEFDAAISKNKPNNNQIYYLEQDLSYNIYSLTSDLTK